MRDRILTSSVYLLAAQGVVKGISFFYNIFLARSLGVTDFGLYIAALSYFTLLSSIADFGISRFIIRETSKDKNKLSELFLTTIFLRLVIVLTFFLLFVLATSIFDFDISRRNLLILAVAAILPQCVSLTIDAGFMGLLKLKFSALGTLLVNFITALVGVWLVLMGYGSFGAIMALLIGQLIYSLVLILIALKQIEIRFHQIKIDLVKKIVIGSWPYGLLGILGLIYFKVDILLLTYLRGNFDTGIYGAAYKFLEAIVFIPSVLASILFPLTAQLHVTKAEGINNFYKKFIKYMLPLSLLIMLCYIFLLPILIEILLPNYLPSITVIKILALSIPFMFIHIPLAQIVLSNERYLKAVIIFSFIPISFNIISNIIFIPIYGYLASAWITVISDIISLAVLSSYLKFFYLKND